MTQQFDDPIPSDSGFFKPSETIGALVGFKVLSFNPAAQTPWGVKPEVMVHITVMHDPMQRHAPGEGWLAQRLSGTGLAPSLGKSVGRTVLGRLAAIRSTGGANPQVILNPPSQADRDYANQLCANDPGLAVLQVAPPAQPAQAAYQPPPGYPTPEAGPTPPPAAQSQPGPPQPPYVPPPGPAPVPPGGPTTPGQTGPPPGPPPVPVAAPPQPPTWNASAGPAQPEEPPF